VGQSGVSVRRVGGNRAGEMRFRRFLRNVRVKPEEMVATARERTVGLVKGRHILAIQDTTTLRDDGNQRSLNLHPTIAVEAHDGGLLGLVEAVFLSRSGGKKHLCAKRPFAEKESCRWLDATKAAASLIAAGADCVTVIADREGDIYEEFAWRPTETHLLIRAHHDRILEDGGGLYDSTKEIAELGRETIDLPANPGRPARKAIVALRAREVTLVRPKRNHPAEAAKLPKNVTLTLIEAREVDPPDIVTPVHWAAVDDAHGDHVCAGATDHRFLPPALDHRTAVPGHEDQGLRYRSGACCRGWTIREPHDGNADRCHSGAANGARARWCGRAAVAGCSRSR
jgi:hypothetical protein